MGGEGFFLAGPPDGPNAPGRLILSEEQLRRSLIRISHEILERNADAGAVALIGVERRGVDIARRIAGLIEEFEGVHVDVGSLDPRLYRDDPGNASARPVLPTEIGFSIEGRPVVLVDDVLYTGRTVRAAMDALRDFGRPSSIQLAVLVDRGHRELPIRADYVGKNVPTARTEDIQVELREVDGADSVVLVQAGQGTGG